MSEMPKLGKRELDLMNALWALGEGSVSDVQSELANHGHEIAYTTVQTMLNRLEAKELVSRKLDGRAYRYAPRLRKPTAAGRALRGVIESFFGGSAEKLATYLVDAKLSEDELDRISKLIDDRKADSK